jgi:hypothetical protein
LTKWSEKNIMAKKDKTDRIISMIRGAFYVDVVARVGGKIQELRFLKNYTDREIRDMVLDTQTPPLIGENSIENPKAAEEQAQVIQQTVPQPPIVPKDRVTRQEMVAALKAAGVANIPINNRNALEAAYAKLQGGDE